LTTVTRIHVFVTAEAHAYVPLPPPDRAPALWAAEDAARELPNLSLEHALQLLKLRRARLAEVREGGYVVGSFVTSKAPPGSGTSRRLQGRLRQALPEERELESAGHN
jgi:hypothetical protein